MVVMLGFVSVCPAQNDAADSNDKKAPPVELRGGDMKTTDGVALKGTYYPGSQGKDTVPIVLLHSWKSDRKEFASLASSLQTLGFAVLAPDLRGHGESRQQQTPGGSRELDASKFTPGQMELMVGEDMEAIKRFLVQKNNEGELNLEKLCLVGSEMGASIAMQWAAYDWSWPQYPGRKQGQYVKALVLLSPQWSMRGLDAKGPLTSPAIRYDISIMILAGKDDAKAYKESQKIHAMLDRYRQESDDTALAKKTLFFKGLPTKLQGAKMLIASELQIDKRISQFIDLRLVQQDYPWHEVGKKAAAKKHE
jgi:pimeloyl-ACP methyl ester carboxylesterase